MTTTTFLPLIIYSAEIIRENETRLMNEVIFADLWLLLQAAVLYLLPGFALAVLLPKWNGSDRWRLLSLTIIGSAFVAYAVFWVYFLGRDTGRAVSYALPVLSVAVVVWKIPKIWKQDVLEVKECGAWLALLLLVASFYF